MQDDILDDRIDVIPQAQLLNTKVYSTRYEFLKTLSPEIRYLEIGVLAGDFSVEVLAATKIKLAVLVDPFDQIDHNANEYGGPRWESPEAHFDFVKKRFEKIQNVRLYKQYFDKFCEMYSGKFDFIYIDANNSFESVYKYLRDAEKLLNDDGIIGINDYSIYQECGLADVKEEIGVVKAVNKFLRNNLEWYVYAFSFNDKLTSDIYLKKSTTNLLFR
jgi:hypothetical protein